MATDEQNRPILLVTGGSRGIGAAVVKLAAARGYDVAINYLSEKLAAEAGRAGGGQRQ